MIEALLHSEEVAALILLVGFGGLWIWAAWHSERQRDDPPGRQTTLREWSR